MELLVTTAILTMISGLILINNSKFGGVVRLESLAYDIALSVRQAQVYGIAVARYGSDVSSNYGVGYGVHFDLSSPTQFLFFGDSNLNGKYDGAELLKTTTVAGGYLLSQLCATTTSGGIDTEACDKTSLDVLFVRPEPDGILSANGTTCYPLTCYTSVRVVIQSPKGNLMSIRIDMNGQISVSSS